MPLKAINRFIHISTLYRFFLSIPKCLFFTIRFIPFDYYGIWLLFHFFVLTITPLLELRYCALEVKMVHRDTSFCSHTKTNQYGSNRNIVKWSQVSIWRVFSLLWLLLLPSLNKIFFLSCTISWSKQDWFNQL